MTSACIGMSPAVPAIDPSLPGYAGSTTISLAAKRLFDLAAAGLLLAASLPVIVLAALAVRLEDGGPAFFKQTRVGKNGRLFTLYKLRSMRVDAEARQEALALKNEMDGPVFKIADDPRVTMVGRLLRAVNIDELPQLVNVLAGDMSMVGPRPMSLRDFCRFSDTYALRRFAVTPGLTCLWQIAPHRNTLRFRDWMELDLRYLDTRSFFLDVLICLKTLPVCLPFRFAPKQRTHHAAPASPGNCRECA